ncbi:MAG TPA: SDR family NAD(P)-dependent oxidoreductase [Thermoanaerobaculia bacterium]
MACQSLLHGDCDVAIAGGACIVLPQAGYVYDPGMMFSADGRCRAFDAAAGGTVPGNGVGLVALKCLDDALAAGDPILAVIKASAVNNDGAQKVDYFAPSVDGQARVIDEALALAGVDPETIGYVEAHGTATLLGDPIEIEALASAYRRHTPRAGFCAIGSVKTNIGHLHTAAGVAGLIKAALMLQHAEIPPSLNYDAPNPRIAFEATPFYVNARLREWPSSPHRRRAAVSSFGFGGTNAHLVLEEAPVRMRGADREGPHVLRLSARTESAIRTMARELAAFLSENRDTRLADVACTLSSRKRFATTCFVVASTVDEAVRKLEACDFVDTADAPLSGNRIALPTYPFERKRYWNDKAAAPPSLDAYARHRLRQALGDRMLVPVDRYRLLTREVRRMVADAPPVLPPDSVWVPLIDRCTDALADVVEGRRAARDVLFPNGSTALVESVYRDAPETRRLNARIARRVVELAADRPLRILEVGAGTGVTAEGVLEALESAGVRYEYTFTDVSPSLLAKSRERLAARYPRLRFEVLDLEAARPAEAFDVVIAAHVLHATRDLRRTLRALGPATLLIAETTAVHDYLTVTFGLLDGWWLAEDGLRLAGSPLVDENGWTSLLKELGFDAVVTDGLIEATRPGGGDVVERILATTAAVLGVARAQLQARRTFAEAGVDSLVSSTLAVELSAALGVPIDATDFYNHPTPEALARHVAPSAPRASEAATETGGQRRIAVIGMAGRFPGAPTLEAFWQLLAEGRDSVREIAPGRWGAELEERDCFDSGFFDVSPLEASRMDPQQRVFLEESWHAFEDAGYDPRTLAGASIGVFAGVQPNDYAGDDAASLSMIGNSLAILPARVAYHLDLKGPTLAVDTACSSSLMAIHLASQSLLNGECDMALAGGVSISLFSPRAHTFFADSGMASPTGRCRTFDAEADGFVPGEGVGVVLLKTLDRALADGDRIDAVIVGCAANQDGKTNGITAPSAPSQAALECRVYERFGIDPSSIQYVEAHGTGTRLGDPIEVQALTESFRRFTNRVAFCALGSVKTNIGHLLTAAGAAGFIKVLLAMRHRQLPPSLHYRNANPLIRLEGSPFYVNDTLRAWEGTPRRAALSAFGFSGTNVHLVLEEGMRGRGRAALPLQPFVRERHWRAEPAAAAARSSEHEWTGAEWFFTDHVVDGRPLLPAVMYLELARRAAGANALREVVWQRPLHADGTVRRVRVTVAASRFAIQAGDEVLCEGTIEASSSAGERVDVAAVRARCNRERSAREFYDALRRGGFAYGQRLRVVARVVSNDRETLAELERREGEFAPALLEGALQSLAAIGDALDGDLPLPFALGRIEWRSGGEPRWAHGERTGTNTYRLRLLDANGTVVAELREYAVRVIETRFLVPYAEVVAATEAPPSVVVDLGDHEIPANAVIVRQGAEWRDTAQYTYELPLADAGAFGRLWNELEARRLDVARVTLLAGDDGLANLQALIAVARSLMIAGRECELLAVASRDIPEQSALAGAILSIARESAKLRPRFILGGSEQRLATRLASMATGRPPIRDRGVYLITGGAGGVGLHLAESLRRDYDAEVVLVGRSPRTFERFLYLQADVADRAQLRAAVETTLQRFGRIDGVIHAAGVTRDALLVHKTPEEIAEVWNAKARGAVHLDEVTRDLPLDFFLLGSSIASLRGNAGQADYAAANRFLDAFAESREALRRDGKRSGRTVSVAWPVWQDAGMATPKEVLDEHRVVPTPAARAVRATWKALALGEARVAIEYGTPAPRQERAGREAGAPLMEWLSELFARELQLPRERVRPDTPFERFGLDSVLVVQLNRALAQRFESLPKTLLFEYRTVRELASYLGDAAEHEPSLPALAPELGDDQSFAVIGISGRFPGADDLDQLWRNLRDARDSIVEIPPERWPLAGFYDPERQKPGLSYAKWGGFLRGVDEFDPLFFRVAPREAESMDPQERLFLETAWHAVENAGYTPAALGERVGVFAGVMYGEYQLFAAEERAAGKFLPAYSPYWSIPNRVSYALNFRGPSLAIDSACSSSLTAIHLACESLRRGECDAALAGGVNLNLHPQKYLGLSNGQFASSDGRCRSFGDGGDGYVPGEGVGVVVLKPLAKAITDGDFIHGVIRGSSVNHGGRTNGFTVPNPGAQGELIAEALGRSGIAPESVGYVEAHGTGTALGDPIELAGLARAFGNGRRRFLGSIKSNIGHLEAASGVAALAKVLLQLQHCQLVPTLHVERVNPALDLEGAGFALVRTLTPWNDVPRRAGISSFGAGGANAHLIVEEAPPAAAPSPAHGLPRLIVLSARTEERLRFYARRLAEYVRTHDVDLADVAFTLAVGREPLVWRLAVIATNREELAERLERGEYDVAQVSWESLDASPIAAASSPHELAAAWLAGSRLPRPGAGRRVPLPGYPFERKRYWAQAVTAAIARPSDAIRIEPDDVLVRDHRPNGRPTLPASAYLSFALDAKGRTSGTFRDVVWPRPLVLNREPRELRIVFDGARFEMASDAGVHCRGVFDQSTTSPGGTMGRVVGRRISREEIYRRFDAIGTHYGPSFRLLESIAAGGDEASAELAGGELPFVLDAAWQAAMPIAADARHAVAPFAAAKIEIRAPMREARRAHVRRTASGYDVTIGNAGGEVLARVEGLAVRPLSGVEFLQSVWLAEAAAARDKAPCRAAIITSEHGRALAEALARRCHAPIVTIDDAANFEVTYFLGGIRGDDDSFDSLERAEREGALALLELTRKWRGALHVVTNGIFAVETNDRVRPWAAATIGLAKTIGNELGSNVRCIDLPASLENVDVLAGLIAAEPDEKGEGEIAFRDGRRYVRRLRHVALDAPESLPLRDRGVYVIAGGAGGLGMATARFLARTSRARIAILGRGAAPAERFEALRAMGAEVLYCRADLTRQDDVRGAIAEVERTWGAIHGVIHSALVLADTSLGRMTEERFREALDPKACGSVHLADAVAGHPLDFFLFYSSANAFSANPGQSNYVAGCTFKDAYAEWLRRERGWNARVINWGYWGEIGSVANEAVRERLGRVGVHPLSEDEGIDALRRILGGPAAQVMAIKATPEALAKLGAVPDLDASTPSDDARHLLEGFAEVELYARAAVCSIAIPAAVPPQHRRLLAALEALRAEGAPASPPARADIERRHPALVPYLRLLDHCLASYPDVLAGRKEPTQILFPAGSLALVEEIYGGNALTEYYNNLVAGAVAGFVRGASRRVRILEIGAGTGGTTQAVLPAVAAAGVPVDYLFTDLSQGFLRGARERWERQYPFVRYQLFDVEQPSGVDEPVD